MEWSNLENERERRGRARTKPLKIQCYAHLYSQESGSHRSHGWRNKFNQGPMCFVKAQTLGGGHVTRLGSQMYNIAWMRTGAGAGCVRTVKQSTTGTTQSATNTRHCDRPPAKICSSKLFFASLFLDYILYIWLKSWSLVLLFHFNVPKKVLRTQRNICKHWMLVCWRFGSDWLCSLKEMLLLCCC